jgi:DNA-binding transcriptional MerR regulator
MTTTIISMQQLEQLTGVQARTLRHWIRRKLMPKPLGRGRAARYTQEHVLRAGVIRQMRSQRASLRAIFGKLSQMTEEQMVAMQPQLGPAAANSVPVATDSVPAPPPAPSYPFQTWEIITLLDGVVLLVNSGGRPASRRIADEIYRYYGGVTRAT